LDGRGGKAVRQSAGDRGPIGGEDRDRGQRGDDVEGDHGTERDEGQDGDDDERQKDRVPRDVGCGRNLLTSVAAPGARMHHPGLTTQVSIPWRGSY